MKKILLVTSFAISVVVNAQGQNVGISNSGNTPDPSAMLDVESSTKGLLIPRLALTQTTVAAPVVTPATSLMVYNTSTVNDVTPGYYYWDGTKWERIMGANNVSVMISDSLTTNVYPLINTNTMNIANLTTQVTTNTNNISTLTTNLNTTNTNLNNLTTVVNNHISTDLDTDPSNELNTNFTVFGGNLNIIDAGGTLSVPLSSINTIDWHVFGNSGTNPSSNFVGTTDNNALTFRVNNIEKLRLETNGTITPMNTGNSVFIGSNAGISDNQLNNGNVFIGASAGLNNVSGSSNAFIGSNAGALNTTGNGNIFMGGSAGFNNTTGATNLFIGTSAGTQNTTGNRNIAFGQQSLSSNTTSDDNIAIGTQALRFNVAGTNNIALGSFSLQNTTSGGINIGIGHVSLQSNTTGESNIGIGYGSMQFNTTGNDNVAIGQSALSQSVNSNTNVAVGRSAMFFLSGNQNVAVGFQANNGLGAFTRTNSIAIGYNSVADDNDAQIGNTATLTIGGYVDWTVLSDGRFKVNVQENVKGLEFINLLRPVTYNLDVPKLNTFIGVNNDDFTKEQIENKSNQVVTGFIAQEVEAAADSVGYNFNGVIKPTSDSDHYSLSYSAFVVPTIKSIQELHQLILDQQAIIEALILKIEAIETK